jgi:hypothetical protein
LLAFSVFFWTFDHPARQSWGAQAGAWQGKGARQPSVSTLLCNMSIHIAIAPFYDLLQYMQDWLLRLIRSPFQTGGPALYSPHSFAMSRLLCILCSYPIVSFLIWYMLSNLKYALQTSNQGLIMQVHNLAKHTWRVCLLGRGGMGGTGCSSFLGAVKADCCCCSSSSSLLVAALSAHA